MSPCPAANCSLLAWSGRPAMRAVVCAGASAPKLCALGLQCTNPESNWQLSHIVCRTIHKSQGMTLDRTIVHLEGCFAEGQVRAGPWGQQAAMGLCTHCVSAAAGSAWELGLAGWARARRKHTGCSGNSSDRPVLTHSVLLPGGWRCLRRRRTWR